MADIKNFNVNGEVYDIKDEIARSSIGDLASLTTEEKSNLVAAINEVAGKAGGGACGITYIESTDTENLTAIRDLESGTYVFYGRFKPNAATTSTLTFSSKLLVNVVKQTSASHVMVFYPVNNCVQYVKITDDAYERTNVYLNDLLASVGTLDDLTTTDKTSLVAAINELAASAGSGGSEAAEIPTFDLAAMGLPAISIDGVEAVVSNVDFSELREALSKGIVNLRVAVSDSGYTVYVVVKACSTYAEYEDAYQIVMNQMTPSADSDEDVDIYVFSIKIYPNTALGICRKIQQANSGASYSLAKGVAF